MLRGENFGGSHQSDLIAILDDDGGGFECDDGFSAADITFQQAIHGKRFFQVGRDFG